ncbi:hypothetical protein [Chitinophaga agri]|uniref:Uncharacterized protein n=1 Tax=Chitinophaga agri TaxID=2703787 RepID=A0A6B9ZC00_9BACT|nr:hypothetical protein [Chitinophaga agri]QHS59848.1 hypothetical protein GWR21_09680 [Chitinophaga agri]
MTYNQKILDIVDNVSFATLQQYLSLRGWKKMPTNNQSVAIFFSPNDDSKLDIMLPLSREFADYRQTVFSAIRKVALYENRDEWQVINDLIAPPADIVRYRVDDESTQIGLIPLKTGFELLESAKKSLLCSASDIIVPSLYHKRIAYKSALQFIDACFLGQSERGSYVASIVCPFIKPSDDERPVQLSLFSSEDALVESLTRKVTKRLMTSIETVKRNIEQGSLDNLIKADNESLISGNFLESIVELNELTQNANIEILASWAPTIPPPTNVPNLVSLTRDYIEPIKEIIERMRPNVIETQGDYVGKISQIRANPDISNRQDGEITFRFISDDEKAVSAKVILEGKNLHEAMLAFEEGKNIKITGNLKTQNRQRYIDNPAFKVID